MSTAEGQDDPGWIDLDADISELQESLSSLERDEWEWGVYLKTFYEYSDDPVFTIDPDTFETLGTKSGFDFGSMAVWFKGEVGDYELKASFNPDKQKLRSTYVRFRPLEKLRITMGRFKAPFLRSRLVKTTKLLFRDRTFQAVQTGARDEGVKAEVYLSDRAHLILAVQNGEDGRADEHLSVARLELDVLGGGVPNQEGAYKVDENPALSLGLAVLDDGTLDDGRSLAADFAYAKDRFSLSGEVLRHGDDFPMYKRGVLDPASRLVRADTKPFDLTTSWMLVRKRCELAARWEEVDDRNDTRRLGVSLNWYRKGRKAKWLLNWYRVYSDLPLLESDLLTVGLIVGF